MPIEVDIFPGFVYARSNGTVCVIADQEPDAPQKIGKVHWTAYTIWEPKKQWILDPQTRGSALTEDIDVILEPLNISQMELMITDRHGETIRNRLVTELHTNNSRGPRRIVIPQLSE